MEAVILLIIYQVQYVFQVNETKTLKKKIFHVIVNVNLVLENVNEIKRRMTKSVSVSVTFSMQKKLCPDS